MKKIYNVPATIVVAFKAQKMLAASGGNPNGNVTVETGGGGVDPEGFDTRKNHGIGGGLWSDMQ